MKFTIRDLFLVTVIVAVCAAWWVDRRAQSARENAIIKAKEVAEWKLERLAALVEESPDTQVTHDSSGVRLRQGTTTKKQWIQGSKLPTPDSPAPAANPKP